MGFIEQCRARLIQHFGLAAQQLQAESVLLETAAADLYVAFHEPSDTVSVYSTATQPFTAQFEELPLPEECMALRQVMETNAELFERSLLRLYLDDVRLGIAVDCSALNCRDGDHFLRAVQDLLTARQQLDNIR